MKNLLLILSLAFFGCKQTLSVDEKLTLQRDSIAMATFEADSLNKIEIAKKEQGKVIGSIMFDISEKDYRREVNSFLKSTRYSEYEFEHKLGDYEFIEIDPFFNNDKLYLLILKGKSINYKDYETELHNQVTALKSALASKYGEPTHGDGEQPWSTMEEGYSYLSYGWVIGTKELEIRVQSNVTHFTVNLHIFQTAVVNKIEAKEKEISTKNAAGAKELL